MEEINTKTEEPREETAAASETQAPAEENVLPAPKTVQDIIVRGLTDRFFQRKGRASRKEYWVLILFQFIVLYIMKFSIQGIPAERVGQTMINVLLGADYILALLLFAMTAAATVRRLHDVGRSGWWAMVYVAAFFFPPLGVLLLTPFTLRASSGQENAYGAPLE